MGMGRKEDRERQEEFWVSTSEIVRTPGHAFYERLNTVLDAEKFDRRIEGDLPEVLQEQRGSAQPDAGDVFPDAAVGLLRGHRFGARHQLAGG